MAKESRRRGMKDDGGWLRWWDLVRNLRWVKKVDLERAIVLEREINREWLYIYDCD